MAGYMEGERPATAEELAGTKNLVDHKLHLGADQTADQYFKNIGHEANTNLGAGEIPLEIRGTTDIRNRPSRSANDVKQPWGMQE